MFAKALIVLAVASQALAGVFITSPTASSTFSGGKEHTVTWIDNGQAPSLKDFGPAKISIYAGNAQQQTSLQTISASVDVSTTASVSFTVDPAIGPNSDQYFIRVESLSLKDTAAPQYPALAFSAKFTLNQMTGTFSPTVLAQIAGQSTAPLASQTSTPPGAAAASATAKTTAASSASRSGTASAAAAAKTSTTANSGALSVKAGWAGVLVGVVAGAALF